MNNPRTITDEGDVGLTIDEKCNRGGCKGILIQGESDDPSASCNCHSNPPCSFCTEDRTYCPKCEWSAKDDD